MFVKSDLRVLMDAYSDDVHQIIEVLEMFAEHSVTVISDSSVSYASRLHMLKGGCDVLGLKGLSLIIVAESKSENKNKVKLMGDLNSYIALGIKVLNEIVTGRR